MKSLSAVAMLATLLSANVFGGDHSINAEGRVGWIYKDNDVKKTGVSNSSSFSIDYLRTTFAGIVTPSVKYFLTTDLLGQTGNDAVDGTSTLIDEAFVTKTFAQGTSLTVGKKAVFIGGREYDYLNSDRYTASYFYAATPANQVGLTVAHEIVSQTFMAQYFNGNKDNGQGTTTNAQSKFGYAVGWYGDLANGLLKPIVAYTVVPEAAASATTLGGTTTRVTKGDDAYLAAGVQVNLPMGLVLEAEYDLLNEKDALADKKNLKTTSLVALLRLPGDRFSPFVKFISDTKKADSTKTASRIAYDLGIEFKEEKDDAIRYHVVYSGSSVKDNIDTTEVKSSPASIMVGLKFVAAIL